MAKLVGTDYEKFKELSDEIKSDAMYRYLYASDDKTTMQMVGDAIGINDYSVSCIMRYYGWSGRNAGTLRAMPLIREDFDRIVKDMPEGAETNEDMLVLLRAYVIERELLKGKSKKEETVAESKDKVSGKAEDVDVVDGKKYESILQKSEDATKEVVITLDVRIVYLVTAAVLFALYMLIEGSDIVSSAINSLIVALGVVAGSYIGTKILMKVGKKDGKK